MKTRKTICILLGAVMLLAAGCGKNSSSTHADEETEPVYEEIKASLGESASFGGMTLTVNAVENPGITMSSTGRAALFFNVTIENGSSETVQANWLNNFTLTIDGTYYESHECATIPVMDELYHFYDTEALAEELAPGESCTGYIAFEVDPDFGSLEFHYIPKTTDKGSMITVPLDRDSMTAVSK